MYTQKTCMRRLFVTRIQEAQGSSEKHETFLIFCKNDELIQLNDWAACDPTREKNWTQFPNQISKTKAKQTTKAKHQTNNKSKTPNKSKPQVKSKYNKPSNQARVELANSSTSKAETINTTNKYQGESPVHHSIQQPGVVNQATKGHYINGLVDMALEGKDFGF